MAGKIDVKSAPILVRVLVMAAISLTGLLCAVGYKYVPLETPETVTVVDKLVFTLRWQVWSCMTLLVGVQIVAITRLVTPAINPLDKDGERYVDAYNRCLQNTLEQLVLNVAGQLILATFLDNEGLKSIPYLVFLFVTGRILFWVGYPFLRSPGFAMTMLPTLLTFGLNLYYLASLGASYRLGRH